MGNCFPVKIFTHLGSRFTDSTFVFPSGNIRINKVRAGTLCKDNPLLDNTSSRKIVRSCDWIDLPVDGYRELLATGSAL